MVSSKTVREIKEQYQSMSLEQLNELYNDLTAKCAVIEDSMADTAELFKPECFSRYKAEVMKPFTNVLRFTKNEGDDHEGDIMFVHGFRKNSDGVLEFRFYTDFYPKCRTQSVLSNKEMRDSAYEYHCVMKKMYEDGEFMDSLEKMLHDKDLEIMDIKLRRSEVRCMIAVRKIERLKSMGDDAETLRKHEIRILKDARPNDYVILGGIYPKNEATLYYRGKYRRLGEWNGKRILTVKDAKDAKNDRKNSGSDFVITQVKQIKSIYGGYVNACE